MKVILVSERTPQAGEEGSSPASLNAQTQEAVGLCLVSPGKTAAMGWGQEALHHQLSTIKSARLGAGQ